MQWAVNPVAVFPSKLLLGIFTLLFAVLLHSRGNQACCDQEWDQCGMVEGDCFSSELESSSGNGDLVSLLQSAVAKDELSNRTLISLDSPRLMLQQVKAGLADHPRSGALADPHRQARTVELSKTRSRASAKQATVDKQASSAGGGTSMVPVVIVGAVVLLLMFIIFAFWGSDQNRRSPYRSSADSHLRLTTGGSTVINRPSDVQRQSYKPPAAYPVGHTQSMQSYAPTIPTMQSLMSTHSAQPTQVDLSKQSPVLRPPVPLQSTHALSATQSSAATPLASRMSPLPSQMLRPGINHSGRYTMPLDDVCCLQFEENWNFNVADAGSGAMLTVELKSLGSKVLELSEFYQVGNTQVFARVAPSQSSAQILDVTIHGALAATINDNGDGTFAIMQSGREALMVDGDVTKGDSKPWVNVRSSNGQVATMVKRPGSSEDILEVSITPPNDPKLLLAAVLGVVSFFDWPRPAMRGL
jgi:hypothetical protein